EGRGAPMLRSRMRPCGAVEVRMRRHLRTRRAALAGILAVVGALVLGGAASSAGRYANPQLLVETNEVARMLGTPSVRIVDLRSGVPGDQAYRTGHVPGAVHLDGSELDAPAANADGLPIRSQAAAALFGRLGIDQETTVVAYDEGGSVMAARLF